MRRLLNCLVSVGRRHDEPFSLCLGACRIGCRRRDDLYKEFIAAASKAYGEAIVSNEPNVQELVALYAMISRMRVKSPPQTVACADFALGKTIREFHELVQSGY